MKLKKFIIITVLSVVVGISAHANPFDYNNSLGFTITSNTLHSYTNDTILWGVEYQHWFDGIGLGFGGNVLAKPESNDFADFQVFTTISECLFKIDMGRYNGGRLFVYETLGVRGFVKENFVVDGMFAAGFGFEFLLSDHISIPLKACLLGEVPHDIGVGFATGIGLKYTF